MENIIDVCLAGSPAVNGQCGDPECVCYYGGSQPQLSRANRDLAVATEKLPVYLKKKFPNRFDNIVFIKPLHITEPTLYSGGGNIRAMVTDGITKLNLWFSEGSWRKA